MGGNSSSQKAQEIRQVVENSSGTHLLEIHIPSMGMSFAVVILCAFLIMMIFWCYKRAGRGSQRRLQMPNLQNSSGLLPFYSQYPALPALQPPQYAPWMTNQSFHPMLSNSAFNQSYQSTPLQQLPMYETERRFEEVPPTRPSRPNQGAKPKSRVPDDIP